MKKIYKLAANFNTVTIEDIDKKDLDKYVDWENEVVWDNEGLPTTTVDDNTLIARLLQDEYDIIAGIKVLTTAPSTIGTEEEKPSEKQIEWARSLGMKDPEKKSKKEVWKYIQEHRRG